MRTWLIRILNKLGILKYFNFQHSIFINQQRFIIPVSKGIGMSMMQPSEKWMTAILKDILDSDGLFVDVGANVGQTLLKLRSVHSTIAYKGFEPNEQCCQYLEQFISINQIQHAEVYPFGISNQSRTAELHLYAADQTDESASIVENYRPKNKVYHTMQVQLKHPKDVDGIQNVNILKIDVEGFELEVIQAFEQIIKRDLPFIFLEVLPVYSLENKDRLIRQEELFQILEALDYDCYRIIKKSLTEPMLEIIKEIGIHKDIHACDYLWVHQGKTDLIKSRIES